MTWTCAVPGCDRGPQDERGSGLYRISPKGKGEKFVGLCDPHYVGYQRGGATLPDRDPDVVAIVKAAFLANSC
jgi:hypothetical protein